MTLDDVETKLSEKLAYAPPFGVTFKFDFGDDGVLFLDGTSTPPQVSREEKDADTTFICSLGLLEKIISGKQDPTMAFMMGKLKVQGSMGNAMKLSSLLED